jgi:hypothetical protein
VESPPNLALSLSIVSQGTGGAPQTLAVISERFERSGLIDPQLCEE